jgi:L-lactate dehydrogenase complex protein LldG
MDERSFIDRFRREGERRPHPGRYQPPAYACTWERFGKVLAAVGGSFDGVLAGAAVAQAVSAAIARSGGQGAGRCVASAAAAPTLTRLGVKGWAAAPQGAAQPHSLADVELGILTAELAVAENAAVLLSSRSLPERALAFLSQHLVVLVPAAALVPDLVTAQARLPVPPPHHLTWMSGPSKTADIEQTLVVGAHGSRSLTVIATADAS